MPDPIPAEAVQAAEHAVRNGVRIRLGENALALAEQGQPLMLSGAEAEHAARVALEAAAPFIAEHIARQFTTVWEWTREVAAAHGTTYGVDAVGKCMRIAREAFPAGDPSPAVCPSAAPGSTESAELSSCVPTSPETPQGVSGPLGVARQQLTDSKESGHA